MEHFLREASAWLDPEEGEILLQACFVPKIGQNRQTAAIVLTSAIDRPAKLLIPSEHGFHKLVPLISLNASVW